MLSSSDLRLPILTPGSDLRLHILVPGLPEAIRRSPQDYRRVESLLARSTGTERSPQGYEAVLCSLFGLEADTHDLPLGALTRFDGTGDVDDRFCLAADPVHLRADLRQVFLLGGESLEIGPDEAASLVEIFNRHFTDHDWRLEATTPAQWHLLLPEPEAVRTWPLREVIERDIDRYLPFGPRGLFWRGVLNETQMLFHDAEVNRARVAAGKLPINGLWLSGAGALPSALNAPYLRVWSNDRLALGLARGAGIEAFCEPSNLISLLMAPEGEHLIALEDPDQLMADCPDLLRTALRQRQIAEIHLYDCAGCRYDFEGPGRWRWWPRRPRMAAGA